MNRWIFQLLIAASMAHAEVAMIFSLQRHGARNLLQKNAYLNDSDSFGGPALLPQGQRMCYSAGKNYFQAGDCVASGHDSVHLTFVLSVPTSAIST